MIQFSDMPSHSRIWIYQSSRKVRPDEEKAILSKADEFVVQWTSHNQSMKASIAIFHNLFIVVCVDEKTAPASGCGIDKSVKFIQNLEKEFNISLLDRMNVAYRKYADTAIYTCKVPELKNSSALTVFNNLIQTKGELEKNWEIPIEKSWHNTLIQNA